MRLPRFLTLPLLCHQCEGQVGWNMNWRPGLHVRMRNWEWKRGGKGISGTEGGRDLRWRKTYIHGNVPGHIDVGFVFIHPHLRGPQGIALSVVIYIIVVGLLGALDVGHSGTWKDFHTPPTLPHLDSSKKAIQSNVDFHRNFFTELLLNTDIHKHRTLLSGCTGYETFSQLLFTRSVDRSQILITLN